MAENKASPNEIVSDIESYFERFLVKPEETMLTKCLVLAMKQVSTPTKLHVKTEEEETNQFCYYHRSREDMSFYLRSFSFFETDQSGARVKAACVGLNIKCLYGAVEESKMHDKKSSISTACMHVESCNSAWSYVCV